VGQSALPACAAVGRRYAAALRFSRQSTAPRTPSVPRALAPRVQGRLKRPVAFDDLVCGSWFERPLQLPGSMLVEAVIHWMASR
jgi:hypothetical protein